MKAIFAFLRHHGLLAVAAIMLTIVTPFLLVSEATVKRFVDNWLNDCILVFEVSQVRANRLLVKGYAQGRLPAVVPITFAAKDAEINSVHFVNLVDTGDIDPYSNLAIHPQTNLACPGQLCESLGSLTSSVYVTVALSDVSPSFVYPFYVDFNGNVRERNLRLFVQYEGGVKDGVCRIERANPFNLFVRLSRLGQFIVAVFVFVGASILIAAARSLAKGGSP